MGAEPIDPLGVPIPTGGPLGILGPEAEPPQISVGDRKIDESIGFNWYIKCNCTVTQKR
jgi:hypothetical protein